MMKSFELDVMLYKCSKTGPVFVTMTLSLFGTVVRTSPNVILAGDTDGAELIPAPVTGTRIGEPVPEKSNSAIPLYTPAEGGAHVT
jgi:hypothetical protein